MRSVLTPARTRAGAGLVLRRGRAHACALGRGARAALALGTPLLVVILTLGSIGRRRPAAEPETSPRAERLPSMVELADPEATAVAQEEQRLVARALDELPERQRYVITQRFGLDGVAVPLKAIARVLGVSPQRAKAIEQAALHDLSIALDPLRPDRHDPDIARPARRHPTER